MRMTTISFFTVNFRTHFLSRGDLSIVSFFQEIDVIAADLTQTWSRMAIVDFSKPFLATSLTLLLKVIYQFQADRSTRNWFFEFPSFHYTLAVKKFFSVICFFTFYHFGAIALGDEFSAKNGNKVRHSNMYQSIASSTFLPLLADAFLPTITFFNTIMADTCQPLFCTKKRPFGQFTREDRRYRLFCKYSTLLKSKI